MEVGHGDVYYMTRHSQDFFDHAVPKVRREDFNCPRLSVTYRALLPPCSEGNSNRPHIQPPSRVPSDQNSTTARRAFNPPKTQVLILSDSKNRSFDCSMFKDPVVAFRRDLFYLRDLYQHRDAISRADIVLISAGVNDVRHNKVDARTLHDHVKSFVAQFKNTQFLFDSISPLSINADRFNRINDCIDNTNEYLLKLSLRTENFKLFDNLCFGLAHLARDGIHLNITGKTVLSHCWINVVLIQLGLRKGILPLRHKFMSLVHNFYLEKG